MRVLSLNCNRNSSRILNEISNQNADVFLLQEWVSHKTDQSGRVSEILDGLGHLTATRYLVTGSKEKHEILHISERILITQHKLFVMVNTYFPAGKTSDRNMHFEELNTVIEELDLPPTIIAGDFNLAPKERDGWFGSEFSKFTKNSERVNFNNLLDVHGLTDIGDNLEWSPTFERLIKGKSSRFRCDLILIQNNIVANSKMWYEHKFRIEKKMSDHSALILEVDS